MKITVVRTSINKSNHLITNVEDKRLKLNLIRPTLRVNNYLKEF